MPYVDLVSSDDYASIWYQTNSPGGNVSGFDPEKPTLVMLHPLFLDASWCHPQLDDPRLHANYNIIVFDTRNTGKSLFRPSGRQDLWVTAADLAHCFYVSSHASLEEGFAGVEQARGAASATSPRTHLRPRALLVGGLAICVTVSPDVDPRRPNTLIVALP